MAEVFCLVTLKAEFQNAKDSWRKGGNKPPSTVPSSLVQPAPPFPKHLGLSLILGSCGFLWLLRFLDSLVWKKSWCSSCSWIRLQWERSMGFSDMMNTLAATFCQCFPLTRMYLQPLAHYPRRQGPLPLLASRRAERPDSSAFSFTTMFSEGWGSRWPRLRRRRRRRRRRNFTN